MSTTPPQFGTAEYKSAGGETCRACNQAISGEYYRINGIQACTKCTDKLNAQVPKDSHAAFVREYRLSVRLRCLQVAADLLEARIVLENALQGFVNQRVVDCP